MELKTISQKLRGIRKACGFTQQQVAAVLNVDRSTYTYYETGKTTPDIRSVKILASLFNTSVDELLAGEDPAEQLLDNYMANSSTNSPAGESADLPETANRLTRAERELLLYYRALPPQERQTLLKELYKTLVPVPYNQKNNE